MKKGLSYLLFLFGIVLVVSNTSITSAYAYGLDISLEITDAFYTNAEPDRSDLENDIVIEFTQNIKFKSTYFYEDDDDDDDDDDEDRNLYYFRITINLIIQLILPSGYSFEYSLEMGVRITEEENDIDAILYMYNHALESGWYEICIESYIVFTSVSAYDSLIFDPPEGTDDTGPTIELVY